MLGERACDRLIARIADPSLRPKLELLPTELVLRSSCGCPPGTAQRREIKPAPRRKQAAASGPSAAMAAGVRKSPVPSTTER
jgi:hypothetical protein